jgi:uncharacterized membrane protein
MSADPEQLARQLSALTARVSQLEAELEQLRRNTAAPQGSPVGYPPDLKAPDRPESTVAVTRRIRQPRASLESRIGSQVFNRVGIVALLIGAAWFLKFAIDERWIGPAARVMIGVVAGSGLVGWSEWFRTREYKAFSYSLKAVGTGLLYLSLWAAYTLFGLIPSSVALLAMVLVTAANAWLCWRQNSEVLAFYAAVGGFLTPLLLWTTESNELSLFSYLLLLDLAVLALVALRPWSRLLLAAFAGTALYAVGWYVQHYTAEKFAPTAFFVVVFFLLFSAAPQLLRNLRLANAAAPLTVEDHLALLLLPLLNGLLAFAELYALLSEPVSTTWRPWVAFGFAAFYLGMLRVARSRRLAGTPTRLSGTYVLLSVIAFTGAIPLAFSGRPIAVCWSVESVLLLALAWTDILRAPRVLRAVGVAVLGLAFTATVSLNSAIRGDFQILLNPRFATYLIGVAAGAVAAWIAQQAIAKGPEEAQRGWRWEGIFASAGATVLLMIGVCLEIAAYWDGQRLSRPERLIAEQFSYSAWSMLLGALLLAGGFLRKTATLRWLGLVLLTLSIAKVFLYDLRELSQGYRILSFLGLGVLLLLVSFVYQRNLLGLRRATQPEQMR